MHEENNYLSYFRYYRDEEVSPDFSWWYCLTDFNVYETSELYKLFKYSSKSEIYESHLFVEFEKIDIIELKKQFLIQRNEYSLFKNISDQEFDLKFNRYIDNSNLIQSWYNFEIDILKSVFDKWCRVNNITNPRIL